MNKDVEEALLLEAKRHPKLQVQDMVKLIVQSCLGVQHLHLDAKQSLALFEEEKQLDKSNAMDIQAIGNGLCRVPLSYMKAEYLPLWNELFMATMLHGKQDVEQCEEAFASLRKTYQCTDDLLIHAKQGVHHSEVYREAYQPHYRIIKKAYVDYFEAILYVWQKIQSKQVAHIGIDGRCASGKTTLSLVLEELFQVPILHLDDYFLPSANRSAKRHAEIGGNVDYERFQKEVLDALAQKKTVYSKRYDCQKDCFLDATIVPYQSCILWEGSYAHHPKFQEVLNARIFITCSPMIQKERLKRRSPQLYERFIKEWIPMEEAYFNTYSIQQQSDLVLDTSNF